MSLARTHSSVFEFVSRSDWPTYALIDAAQYPNFKSNTIPRIRPEELTSLLGEHANHDAALVGPILISLDNHKLDRCLSWLTSSMDTANFVSFLSSPVDFPILKQHLTWLTDVVHDDGTEWVMRYYDPRILPFWLDVLSPVQRDVALGPIGNWLYQDHAGTVTVVSGNASPIEHPTECLRMSDGQHERLMEYLLPYTIFQMLKDDSPEICSALTVWTEYQTISSMLNQARDVGLSSTIDLKIFCFLALQCKQNFVDDPSVSLALRRLDNAPFHHAVAAWDGTVWDRLISK